MTEIQIKVNQNYPKFLIFWKLPFRNFCNFISFQNQIFLLNHQVL